MYVFFVNFVAFTMDFPPKASSSFSFFVVISRVQALSGCIDFLCRLPYMRTSYQILAKLQSSISNYLN